MLGEKVNKVLGDGGPSHFGSGWWSGILSAFFGLLSLGAVICLHYPQVLTSPELRGYYPMPLMRMLIQGLVVAAIQLVPVLPRDVKRVALRGKRRPRTGGWAASDCVQAVIASVSLRTSAYRRMRRHPRVRPMARAWRGPWRP